MSVLEYRFQVVHNDCGYIEGFTNLQEAIDYAQSYVKRTLPSGGKFWTYPDNPEIYDLMAHIGKPDLYDINGKPIRTREEE